MEGKFLFFVIISVSCFQYAICDEVQSDERFKRSHESDVIPLTQYRNLNKYQDEIHDSKTNPRYYINKVRPLKERVHSRPAAKQRPVIVPTNPINVPFEELKKKYPNLKTKVESHEDHTFDKGNKNKITADNNTTQENVIYEENVENDLESIINNDITEKFSIKSTDNVSESKRKVNNASTNFFDDSDDVFKYHNRKIKDKAKASDKSNKKTDKKRNKPKILRVITDGVSSHDREAEANVQESCHEINENEVVNNTTSQVKFPHKGKQSDETSNNNSSTNNEPNTNLPKSLQTTSREKPNTPKNIIKELINTPSRILKKLTGPVLQKTDTVIEQETPVVSQIETFEDPKATIEIETETFDEITPTEIINNPTAQIIPNINQDTYCNEYDLCNGNEEISNENIANDQNLMFHNPYNYYYNTNYRANPNIYSDNVNIDRDGIWRKWRNTAIKIKFPFQQNYSKNLETYLNEYFLRGNPIINPLINCNGYYRNQNVPIYPC